jgi:hypothetical protein|tara:strand:+ start:95 stop:418 length:324 start_codon:yes stop_codon:yes gene_type:complete
MASGVLGTQQSLAANTLTTIYTVPASTVAYCNFNIVNTNATAVDVRVAIAAADTPTAAEYVEYNAEIGGYGVLERTGFAMQTGKKLVAFSDTTGVSISAYGVEESTA